MAQLSDSIEQFIKELMSEDAHIGTRINCAFRTPYFGSYSRPLFYFLPSFPNP